MPCLKIATLLLGIIPAVAMSQAGNVKDNRDKLADDPTKVITKVGVSYADNFDFDDSNVSVSGSFAFDQARKINLRVNSDASEWRVGGSWLFPLTIINFNFGKNQYVNGANQTNYSIGTFMPLSYFGFVPGGFQIFPMAGYTYNDGEYPECSEPCSTDNITVDISPEGGFHMVSSKGGSG
ncbi:hypothetical protein [Alteromonas aestuariivivens]|uniref:hypothetical protein n=1 Tax=Alteromonas aestuariivivens TaxID=1938339 RepID=UPI001C6A77D2|nr:hypothetical protein [Alteromonas aestuariivivens]